MRPRPLLWLLLSLVCFGGAFYFWRLGNRWNGDRHAAPAADTAAVQATRHAPAPIPLLTQPGALNVPPTAAAVTNEVAAATNRFALRLSNTAASLRELQRNDRAILLENALLDTANPVPAIPGHLRAQGDPGAYLVQARGPIDNAFRAVLQSAGATFVSYIPNNAYLVRASAAAAQQLASAPRVQSVLPYEPYYKLKGSLLKVAVEQDLLPDKAPLSVLLFSDARESARAELERLGARIVGSEEMSPFGPVLQVAAPSTGLPTIAGLTGVQEVEWALRRAPANDYTRVRINESVDIVSSNNYLGLTGSNVLVAVNDSGVDSTHPDLAPRVFAPFTNALVDVNGHGTHVAGVIASSGGQSVTVSNASGPGGLYSGTNTSFRGKAPAANIYSLSFGMMTKPVSSGDVLFYPPDGILQEAAARTNALISNNSWNYTGPGADTYNIHAASYDAAVRDALPTVSGSQPLMMVFSAGNAGGGDDDGTGGRGDTILSPGTAKNVITVGAIELLRNVTNEVWKCTTIDGTNSCNTNQPWLGSTDASDEIASFSSRGPVGRSIEGENGRFKPDVVAPGTFIVSTKSAQWDTNAYYNPTSHIYFLYEDVFLPTNMLYLDSIYIPENAVGFGVSLLPNTNSPDPFPNLLMYARSDRFPTNTDPAINTNAFWIPDDGGLSLPPVNQYWFYGISNPTPATVVCDLLTDIMVTNDLGNYLQVLQGMNDGLGPYYRYESGTSIAAASVSGTLALMQEFFQQRLGRTNSPALMKALLINGARSVGNLYDFNVRARVNSQGWGLINLPTTLPGSLTNQNTVTNTMVMVDQSPTNALATGQSRTYKISLSSFARRLPLRATLVWTDPPGNPLASTKLVNDLDLVITNLDNTNFVYIGNDIGSSSDFNNRWDTNGPPNIDTVNNVENIFLSPSLGINSQLSTNYSITVVGRRVNVNAVTAQTNNVSQDYALVISSGDGTITNAIGFDASGAIVYSNQPLVTTITNSFANSPGFYGSILFNQRAGANPELLGTNTLALTNEGSATLTMGVTNQWHFYVITNEMGYSNAAFLTFLPENLAVPRMGVFQPTAERAVRPEADVDLYVTPPAIPNNFGLTNLEPAVVSAATKSLSRGGTETIVLSNATAGVYYIGVKSEDHMAGQYALMGVFSLLPFGSGDSNGVHLVGIPVMQPIPDGSPETPGVATIIAPCVGTVQIRRVIVTNIVSHELMGDLIGALSHGDNYAVLNNHTCVIDPTTTACQTWTSYVYDDSDEHNVGPDPSLINPHLQHTDGPNSLNSFAGQEGQGQWIFSMVDNATNHIGTNINLGIFLERQQDLTGQGIVATIQPHSCRNDFIDVPANATSLTITVAVVSATGPVDYTIELCSLASGSCKSTEVTNGVVGSVTIDQTDVPPLEVNTTYRVRVCNRTDQAITVNIRAVFAFAETTILPVLRDSTVAPIPITDDAVSYIYLTNRFHNIISSVDVGLLIRDPRISDLAITLISPRGTRILLFENRGSASTNGLGTFNLATNYLMETFYTNNFDLAPVGLYAPGATFDGWGVVSNYVDVIDDYTCLCLSNHILALFDGAVTNSLPTTNAMVASNSLPYILSYKVNHLPWLEGMVTWWPLDWEGNDLFGGYNGQLFGDVTFSTGNTAQFFDDMAGPVNAAWQASLPNVGTGGSALPIETYAGAPNSSFAATCGNTVMRLANSLNPLERRGWSSSTVYRGQSFRYEVRFQTPASSSQGLLELWILDAVNSNRWDNISLFVGTNRSVLCGSSIDGSYNTVPYTFGDSAWYRLVIAAAPNEGVRAVFLGDDGTTELAAFSFNHSALAFAGGYRIGLSQFVGVAGTSQTVDVSVDYASMVSGLAGKVDQAYYGDGVASRMVVPYCRELDLGLGRGFSIEGWINPSNLATGTNAGPTTVSVPGSYPWTGWPYNCANMWVDTGIDVAAGQQLIITATGSINFGGGSAGPNGAAFNGDNFTPYTIIPYTQLSSLIGKIGGTTAVDTGTPVPEGTAGKGAGFVGSSYSKVVHQSGRLFLTFNDQIWFQDNSGTFSATIQVVTPSTAAPLVEWYNSDTNRDSRGVQLWLAGLPGLTMNPASLCANIWDTNLQPHVITTAANAITNGGWQHVALTYDTNSNTAVLYTNGQSAATLQFQDRFVPRTFGDVYLGYDPTVYGTPINYPTFASITGLNRVGVAAQSGNVLRITPASGGVTGGAWAANKQSCASGFDTQFTFQISGFGGSGGGDGLAFAVQNVGPTAANQFGGMQSGASSISVFFNTFYNWPACSPGPMCEVSGNSVGIVTNSAYLTQVNLAPFGINLKDGAVHQARIVYSGAALTVWLDGRAIFSSVPVPITGAVDSDGKAWVGFTALTGGAWENHDVLSWTFGGPSSPSCYNGGLDEFSLYQRALTPCEVGAIYNAGTRGKYGTNVLVCPVVTEVTLSNSPAVQTFIFTNGLSWITNGPRWETNTFTFYGSTNPTAMSVRGYNPYDPLYTNAANNLNAVVDEFVLSELVPQSFDGLLHFTENTNLATTAIKFAPAPYEATNFPPVLIFTNDFRYATAGVFQAGATLAAPTNGTDIGARDWRVAVGPVTVVSNAWMDSTTTNWLALSLGAVQCDIPTSPGHRYRLNYNLRGPCAVGWWNGSVEPLSQRAWDLISGNNGAFFYGATNTAPGFVGSSGFYFSGQTEPPPGQDPDIWPEDIDDPSSKIELADPPQLQFTNDFTIEGWVKPLLPETNDTYCARELIFFRGYPEPFDCRGLGDPYWLALEPALDGDPLHREIHFHIADAHTNTLGADVFTTNSPVIIGGGSNNGWWHITAVFDKPYTNITQVSGTNITTVSTNSLRIYLNGVCVASNYTTISPYQDLDPALSPGVAIGNRCRFDWTQPFYGFMDEITLYARCLTEPEISAIAAAGTAGKADPTVAADQSLAKLRVLLNGVPLLVSYGDNSQWTSQSVEFTALRTNATLTLQSLLPGTLVEGVSLTELPPELYYLPEVSLNDLQGEDAYGIWTLEIWDNRAGPTTNAAELVQWQLNLGFAPSNPPPVITLTHGIPYTNSLPAHGIQYFNVPVPQWANFATNILQFAQQVRTANPAPVTVLFNPTNFPTPADFPLVGPLVAAGSTTLSTNTTPALTNGQSYYLAVTNPNPVGVTFALGVAFDITTLNNCQLSLSNIVGTAGIPRYFQFDVPTYTVPPGALPQSVSFWLSSTQCNLKVVLSEHLPLPDLNHFDYTSQLGCTNQQIIMLVTNNTPFPIQTNRWYVGVYNTGYTNTSFDVQACYNANYPIIIPLTNGVPFVVPFTNSPFVAPPGPPQQFYFDFVVTNAVSGVLFELYNLSGDADLVLQQEGPPTMAPYLRGSYFTGRSPEQIVLRNTALAPADVAMADLRGHWYLGVYNNELWNVAYTIRASLPNAAGILPSGQPLRMALNPRALPNGLLLNWNSVVGERYIVQYTPSIAQPVIWTNIGYVTATTTYTTYDISPAPPPGFFRVVQVAAFQPVLKVQVAPGSQVKLSWSTAFPEYTLQSRDGVKGTWTNLAVPPATTSLAEDHEFILYEPLGVTPKFFRLVK